MSTEEPGERAPAPEPVRLVQAFINTNDLEGGPERLPDDAALRAWLDGQGLDPGDDVSPADHARAIELRESLRELVAANGGLDHDPGAAARVTAAGDRAGLHPVLTAHDAAALEPAVDGVDAALGRIVAAVYAGIADGSWPRLKACGRDTCRWAFYDQSKNRSSHWCSMAVCGQREKNKRAYRRRRARAAD